MYLFISLAAYLAAECAALIFVADHIGWPAALLLVFLISMGGAHLVRRQGAQALARIQAAMARNESPGAELLEGAFIFAAGLFLFLPGFLTDLIGLALLMPFMRKIFAPWLLAGLRSRVKRGRYIKTYTVHDYEWHEPESGNAREVGVIDVSLSQTPGPRSDNAAGKNYGPGGRA